MNNFLESKIAYGRFQYIFEIEEGDFRREAFVLLVLSYNPFCLGLFAFTDNMGEEDLLRV